LSCAAGRAVRFGSYRRWSTCLTRQGILAPWTMTRLGVHSDG
jgi:hypothetical protein